MKKYSEEHVWIAHDSAETWGATVGITVHAQEVLGDVVFVELPAVGAVLAAGEKAGLVESVKAAADLYMPVGGTVTEVNEVLRSEPSLANRDPLDSGWFFKITMSQPAEMDALMDELAYTGFAN
ncbi:MAG: glycine cleavage system protein GcvH [Betaproteobacteria bacterium]